MPSPHEPADISNWKSFNSSYEYSIKYPVGWTVGAPGGASPEDIPEPVFDSPCNYDKGDRCLQMFISSDKYDPKGSGDKFSPSFIIGSADKTQNQINLTVDGESAIGFNYFQGNYIGTRWQYVVVFTHNSMKYTLTYEESQKGVGVITPADWKNKQLFDQILSTFKFTK